MASQRPQSMYRPCYRPYVTNARSQGLICHSISAIIWTCDAQPSSGHAQSPAWNSSGTRHCPELGRTVLERARTNAPGTVLGRTIDCTWGAPSSSGHARMHLERCWDASFGPGTNHPRAGTHGMQLEHSWDAPCAPASSGHARNTFGTVLGRAILWTWEAPSSSGKHFLFTKSPTATPYKNLPRLLSDKSSITLHNTDHDVHRSCGIFRWHKKSPHPIGVSRRVRLFPPIPPNQIQNPTNPLGVGGLTICITAVKNPPSPARGRGLSLLLINKHPLPRPTGGEPDTMPPPVPPTTHTHNIPVKTNT